MTRYREIVCSLVAAACLAQQQDAPRSAAHPTLIEFTITAVDGKGNPVTDLRRDEISAGENGQDRELVDLRFEGLAEPGVARKLAPGWFTNRPQYLPGPPRNVLAVVVDPRIAQEAMPYLTVPAPEARIAVYELGTRVTVLHDLTDDPGTLRERLAKGGKARTFADIFPGASAAAGESPTFSRSLDELEELGDHLMAIPGRKILVWVGAGIPGADDGQAVRLAAQHLATDGIAVYPVTANAQPSALDAMAEVTGGRAIRGVRDAIEGAKVVSGDLRGAYTARFYSTQEPDGDWHEVALKVQRKGVRLTARQGYLSPEAADSPQDWTDDQWTEAIRNPIASTAIRLDAWCELIPSPEGATIHARLQVPNQDLYFREMDGQRRGEIEFALAEKDGAGEYRLQKRHAAVHSAANSTHDPAAEAIEYSGPWKIRSDSSALRLFVRDRLTGSYGAIDIAVKSIPTEGETSPEAVTSPTALAGPSDPFIEQARTAALAFLDTLPNYVVKQTTNRSSQARSNRGWTLQDQITAELVYEAGKETTRDVMLNGKPVSAADIEKTGAWSTGQFGGMLNSLFARESAAVFKERHGSAKVAGREARVYDFSVQKANSMWELSSGSSKYVAGYDGTIWLDQETARTLRIQLKARDLPAEFPVDQAESSTQYGFVRIGSGEYLVPTESVALVCTKSETTVAVGRLRGTTSPTRLCGRNAIEFKGYRQFGAEANISFDGK